MSQPPTSLAAGARIGAYEVVASIGHGGMGQVYRAVDSRLKREVAVKVLPAALEADPERLARFRREAELLASLNHPNIAHVYGLEEADGKHALVMELATGVTLAERIAAGRMPHDDAMAIARQLLDALEAAHERGIIHRDLKPANIMIGPDGSVKVLDFGLAKAIGADGAGGDAAQSAAVGATITSPAMTAAGMLLGTAAYMAPEQARGRAVDRRADLWAFGCVLYEMLTGARAFGGDDVTETLANVLKSAVRFASIPAGVPARVHQVIVACLQKDVRQRLASAQDARLLLAGAFEPHASADVVPAPETPVWRRMAPYAVGAITATLVVGLLAWRLAPAAALPNSRFSIAVPDGQEFRNTERHVLAVSPDGSALVYNAADGLRLRRFSELASRVIPGTESPLTNPVFSPDGQHVAFYSTVDNQIKRMALDGGAPSVLTRDMANPWGIDWSESGTILLALHDGSIARVPATGGTPDIIVERHQAEILAMPQLLPEVDAVLFTSVTATSGEGYQWRVMAHSLRTGQRTTLVDGARDARWLPTGHLVYAVDDSLFAIRFDPETLTTSGASIALVQGVWWRRSTAIAANWSVSTNGTLIYAPNMPEEPLRPVWVSRDGAAALADHVPPAKAPRLSPDGRELLVQVENDIWIYDLETGRRRRLTTDQSSTRPAWHPTGARIAYTSTRDGGAEVWIASADGTGTPRRLTNLPGVAHVDSWSPDGRTLAFHHHPLGDAPNEILVIAPDDPTSTPVPIVQGTFDAEDAVFSPDDRYVAYLSAESGEREIYVRAFPGPGPQVPVSVGGGREPVWGRTGEIFYRSLNGDRMMAVKVTTTPALTVGTPLRLFDGSYFMESVTGSPRPQYDVTADGRRFLMLQVERTSAAQIVVVQNWFDELRHALPTR